MLKPVLGIAATGVLALLLWKVMAIFLLPLLGLAIGFVFLAIKIGFIVGAVCLLIWVFKRLNRTADA
jgi:TRAP-type C4-dicarboxylate transport system permease small subunit